MQKLSLISALAAAGALAASAAAAAPAGYYGEATLAAAASAPKEAVVNGVAWKCEADKCVGQAARYTSLDSPIRECRKVAAELGPVTSYAAQGRVLSAGAVKVCNANALAHAGAKAGVSEAAQK
jgi:hypothetical protein